MKTIVYIVKSVSHIVGNYTILLIMMPLYKPIDLNLSLSQVTLFVKCLMKYYQTSSVLLRNG